jgi:site-specific recombinase
MEQTALKATEIVITGMSKVELFAIFVLAVVLIVAATLVMNVVVSLKLAVFKDMPQELKEINSKLKTGADLQRIAKEEVMEHERQFHLKKTPK